MNIKRRVLALVVMLCMLIPLCLVQVSADKTEPVAYDFFCDELKDLTYDAKGGASFNKYKNDLNSLYANGTVNAVPYAVSSKSAPFIQYGAESGGQFEYDGFRQQKVTVGDWVAIKFRSPGEGFFSVSVKHYFLNQNNAAALTAYLLPGSTAESTIGALLTEDNVLGLADIVETTTLKSENTLRLTTGAELEAGKEYLLVLQASKDHHNADDARLDFMLMGLEFGEGYEPGEGAFNPIRGEVMVTDPVKIAQYYRAHSGVNPADGHDMLYLMIKGGDLMVYDLDTREIVDTKTDIHRQQKGSCIDPEGNLWICGSGNLIYKYDPTTKVGTKYTWNYNLVDGNKVESYGIVYGDDGYLYFGYYGWLLRMDPKTGDTIRISERLTLDDKPSDAQFTGHGGIVYKDGFLYLAIHGDMNTDQILTSAIIKYDIANRKIVQSIDIADATNGEKYQHHYGVAFMNYMDGILYGSFSGRSDQQVYIDITGDQMVRLDSVEGLNTELVGAFTQLLNGKYYMTGYVDEKESTKCLYEYDPATKTFARITDVFFAATLTTRNAVVTIDNDLLPGLSIVSAYNNTATGMVDLYFYNIESCETVIWDGISKGYGTGVNLNALMTDDTGRYLYTGGYGSNMLGIYDTQTGKTEMYPTHDHQVDSLMWYDGYLWVGNYDCGTITRYDTEYNEATPLFEMMSSVFQQVRMLNPTAGENKIFFAGEPASNRYGGVLAWYDIEKELTYIAAGPNPEDVYYAKTTASFVVWRNAVTHQIETFDEDGDSIYDFNLVDENGKEVQRFYGVVPYRILASMNYVDGYIIGSTTKENGKTAYAKEGNAELFVYDVNAMKILATYDITETIQGLLDPKDGDLGLIDTVAPDPYEKGKYWGVVVDTLFSFTFDFETLTFNVKEEMSWAKGIEHKPHGTKQGTDILFDGDYMYVSTQHMGTYMVSTADPSVNYQLSGTGTAEMVQLPDGNIYYLSMRDGVNSNIKVFRCAEVTQPLVLRSVQAVIEALPETMTAENEAQFMVAYKMYMDLIDSTREQVTNKEKLLTAVGAFAQDQAAQADARIDAIGEVTLQSEAAILAARRYYESISQEAKALVTKLNILEDAELALNELKLADMEQKQKPPVGHPDPGNDKGSNLWLFIGIGAAVVVIVAAVVAVIVLRKKKPTEE